MLSDFATVPFADSARAAINLARMQKRLPARLLAALPTLLGPLPDPDGALNYLERFLLGNAPGLEETLAYMTRHPAALHYALVLFSHSRYLSESLVQQPQLLTWLHRPTKSRQFRRGIEHIKSPEDLEEDFARFETSEIDLDPGVLLARFKRREYLRITLRDVLGLASLAETTLELSELADLLLRRALHMAEARLSSQYGQPQTTDAAGRLHPALLSVLSLGKLGARELNYNSDIDLIFLFTGHGETSGGPAGKLTNPEYFVRVSHQILKLVSEVTPEGALYRVDMRLRPRGAEGFLAVSLASAREYYRTVAREWELQMLIKARPSAGDLDAGRKFLRELHPLIFRSDFNVAAVEAVLNARQEITRSLRRRAVQAVQETGSDYDAQWNVKLTPGGIRDIEFLAQCLQRVYGGTDAWLSAPAASGTLVALQRLHDKGHVSGRDFFHLAEAYQFFRKVEHRLQLREGLQRHTLPDPASSAPGSLDRLARRCGVEPGEGRTAGEELRRRIAQHFSAVREIYQRILVKYRPTVERASAKDPSHLQAGEPGALLARLDRELPPVAAALRAASGDPLARRGLHRLLSSAVHESAVMAELAAHPERVVAAAGLFSRSDLAVEMLARHPADLSLIAAADPVATPPPDLSRLRRAYRRRNTRVLIESLLRSPDPGTPEVPAPFPELRTQSLLAVEALAEALPLVAQSLGEPALAGFRTSDDLASAPFVVLALGRLGTHEMDFGSDADLVFVAEGTLSPELREPWRRLAERLIHTVSSHTREGLLFPVDTRLRPRGHEGDMVQSAIYLCDYLAKEAVAWEAVSWLKALPVAGNLALGKSIVARAHGVLRERWSARGAALLHQELRTMRSRLEKEGTGLHSRTEFKHVAGGFFDIEYILGFLFLQNPATGAASLFPHAANVVEQIAALRDTGRVAVETAGELQGQAAFLRAVDHAHRLVTGRAANRTPDPALAERLARLLQQWGFPLQSPTACALESALAATRASVRKTYQQYFA